MIGWFACNFAPQGWQMAQGQTLSISQNAALFSILGTYYGGNGVSTFQLPDLRGRTPFSSGSNAQGTYVLGQVGGNETVMLSLAQMPAHTHLVQASKSDGTIATPGTSVVFAGNKTDRPYSIDPTDKTMSPATVGTAGSGLPFSIVQPYNVLVACIATTGIYPSRN
jgi:microcystin-dependent protein